MGDANDENTGGIEIAMYQIPLPKPLVEIILASAARQTPALTRNQEIERALSVFYNWSRAAELADRKKG